MLHRLILPLAYIATLTGCLSKPPLGEFVEYREGQTPTTRPIKYEATYELCAKDRPDIPPLTAHHVMKGERVGFCRDKDGSVAAVAPGYSLPLPPGAYAWNVVPGTGPTPNERAWCDIRERSFAVARVTLIVVGITLIVVLVAGIVLIVAFSKSNSPGFV